MIDTSRTPIWDKDGVLKDTLMNLMKDAEWDKLVECAWNKYETVGYQGERFMYESDFAAALEFVRNQLFLPR